jgi:hypothetical protein
VRPERLGEVGDADLLDHPHGSECAGSLWLDSDVAMWWQCVDSGYAGPQENAGAMHFSDVDEHGNRAPESSRLGRAARTGQATKLVETNGASVSIARVGTTIRWTWQRQ